jgi:uncharacterized protein
VANGNERSLGDVGVTIDGRDLPPAAYEDLLEATVHDDLAAPSMFTLKLNAWNDQVASLAWVDSTLFNIGADVGISLGYPGALSLMMKGEITGVELEMSAEEPPALVVRGYDRRHRLLRGVKTRSFVGMPDSKIAEQIAIEQGLSPSIVNTGVKLEYVLQHGQADLHFLSERAAKIGYEVTVEDRTLHYRPRQNAAKPALAINADVDLIDFYPKLSTRGQVGGVEVRGWDPATKKPVVGRAAAGQEQPMGTVAGTQASDKAFGKAFATWVDTSVSRQQEADQMALAMLRGLSLNFIRGEGTCFGRTDLRAGVVANVLGIGARFSGLYYVTSTRHTYSLSQGYRTGFDVRRNAT